MTETASKTEDLASRTNAFIDSLVCGLPNALRRTRKLLMLTVFCDDSGTDGVPAFCAIAGYVSDAERWKRFSDEWLAELDSEPKLEYLKMREAESRRGQFWGWDVEVRDQKLLRLAKIIKNNVIGGIGSFVSNKAYKAIAKGFLPSTVDHPYWLCFQKVVLGAVQIYKEQVDGGKIHFVFDSQGEGFERRASMIHNGWESALTSPFRDLLGGLSFASDLDMVPIQAADMLAWQMRRHADRMAQGTPETRAVAEVLWSIPTPAGA